MPGSCCPDGRARTDRVKPDVDVAQGAARATLDVRSQMKRIYRAGAVVGALFRTESSTISPFARP